MTERKIDLNATVRNNPISALQDVEYVHLLNGKRYVMHPFKNVKNVNGEGKGLYSIRKNKKTTPNAYITLEELAELFAIDGFTKLGANIRMKPSEVKYPTSPPALQPTAEHVKANTTFSNLVRQKSDLINQHGISESLRNKLTSIGIAAADSDVLAFKDGRSGSISFGESIELSSPDSGKNSDSPIPSEAERDSVIPVGAQGSLESDTRSLKTDEREAVVKVRFGQGSFREALFKEQNYGERCWMSGTEGGRLLIASHIKPWSHCNSDTDSRGRTDNGLLLSALWDAAFDAGFISFDPNWNVVASSKLSESARYALNLNEHSTLPEMFRTEGRKEYLAYHRANVFEYWTKKDLL